MWQSPATDGNLEIMPNFVGVVARDHNMNDVPCKDYTTWTSNPNRNPNSLFQYLLLLKKEKVENEKSN